MFFLYMTSLRFCRWPPPAPPKPAVTANEKRLEKNLKRKQVPVLSVDPILEEKILAMRVMATQNHDHSLADGTREGATAPIVQKRGFGKNKKSMAAMPKVAKGKPNSRKTRGSEVRRHTSSNEQRTKRKSQRNKKQNHIESSSDEDPTYRVQEEGTDDLSRQFPKTIESLSTTDHRREKLRTTASETPSNDKQDVASDDRKVTTPIVIQEIKMDGPAGKKPRIVKILATEPGQSVDEATIVVEAPPPTPQPVEVGDAGAEGDATHQSGKRPPMVSLLRQGATMLKSGSSSVPKQGATVSLLKRRESLSLLVPSASGCIEVKNPLTPGAMSADGEQFFERGLAQQSFDEGPLQTPQPPCITDD